MVVLVEEMVGCVTDLVGEFGGHSTLSLLEVDLGDK